MSDTYRNWLTNEYNRLVTEAQELGEQLTKAWRPDNVQEVIRIEKERAYKQGQINAIYRAKREYVNNVCHYCPIGTGGHCESCDHYEGLSEADKQSIAANARYVVESEWYQPSELKEI
jgi:hypothetical protein